MSRSQTPALLVDVDPTRREGALEGGNRIESVAVAAHEHVDCREPEFRPRVNADVGFGQYHDARNAASSQEFVQVHVQDRGVRLAGRIEKRTFDRIDVIKVAGAPKIDEQVEAGKARPVALDEVVARGLGRLGARENRGAPSPTSRASLSARAGCVAFLPIAPRAHG